MEGVGRGTVLGGRYRLLEPQDSDATHADWRGVDQTLSRDIVVRVVRGPAAEDVLDAGRRAAVVDDPRLQRVLDVGTYQPHDADPPATYVVFERVEGTSLAHLLDRTPQLPANRVRAIVGETAAALARAADVGVHHGALRPDVVVRTPDGRVKVTGLAVDAITRDALEPGAWAASPTSPPTGPGDTAVIPPVPHDGVSPAETDDAVGLVALLYAGLTGRWPLPETPGLPSRLQPAPLVSGYPVPPDDLVGGVPNDMDTLCAVVFGPHEDGPRTPAEVVEQLRPWGPVDDGAEPPLASPAVVVPVASAPAAGTPSRRPPRAFPGRRQPPRPAAAVPVAAAPAAAASLAAAPLAAEPIAAEPVAAESVSRDDDPFLPLPSSNAEDPVLPEHRFYQDVSSDDDSRSRLVLVVVGVVLVLGLAFAVNSLRGIGGDIDPVADPEASAPAETEAPAEEETPGEEEPTEEAAAAPIVAGIRSLDPEGDDGTENDDSAPRAIDDDPASTWNSSTYASADFGGLKDGVGLALPLSTPALVSGATVTMNGTGGTVELRAAPGASLDDSTVLASGSPVDGVVELEVAEPVETSNVLLWFTQLPDVAGEFRLEVGQVQLR